MPFTPGPWEVGPPADDSPPSVIASIRGNGEDDSGLWQIADVIRGPALLDGRDCAEGNARLIAAAPALLAACKTFLAVMPHYRRGEVLEAKIREAVALAENSADCS